MSVAKAIEVLTGFPNLPVFVVEIPLALHYTFFVVTGVLNLPVGIIIGPCTVLLPVKKVSFHLFELFRSIEKPFPMATLFATLILPLGFTNT